MVVYGFNPRAPIDLLPLPPSEIVNLDATQRSKFILKLHETTKLQIEKMNEKYRIAASKGKKEVKLEPGDLVWVHLRTDRFSDLRKSKLGTQVYCTSRKIRTQHPIKIVPKNGGMIVV
jgi:translation initiation factor IF-1